MFDDSVDIRVYDQLVTEAYKIGTGEGSPQEFVNFYAAMFPSQFTSILGFDQKRLGSEIDVYAGSSRKTINDFVNYFAGISPYLPIVSTMPTLTLSRGTHFLPEEEFLKTEYYNDFIKPNEDVSQTNGIIVFKENDRFLMWSSLFSTRYPSESNAAEQAMLLLVPHVRRSFELARRLDIQSHISNALENTLSLFSSPVFICSADMEIYFSNRVAEAELNDSKLFTSRQNRLRFSSVDANLRIQQKVKNFATENFSPASLSNDLFVPLGYSLAPTRFAFITPLPDREGSQRSIFGSMFPRSVLIMIVDPDATGSVEENIIQAVFGVTPAEAMLASALGRGMSPSEYADERQVSRNTVRVQTQALLAKMGARRQSDITRMLATAFAHLRK